MSGSKRRSNRDSWKMHMASWERSNISQKEYCSKKGIKYQTFLFWRRQLKREGYDSKVNLVQLREKVNINSIINQPGKENKIKLFFGDYNLEFYPGTSADIISGIVRALKSV